MAFEHLSVEAHDLVATSPHRVTSRTAERLALLMKDGRSSDALKVISSLIEDPDLTQEAALSRLVAASKTPPVRDIAVVESGKKNFARVVCTAGRIGIELMQPNPLLEARIRDCVQLEMAKFLEESPE